MTADRLKVALNFAIAVTALALAAVAFNGRRSTMRRYPAVPQPGTLAQFECLPRRTLVVAVNHGCSACERAAPAIRAIVQRAKAEHIAVRALLPREAGIDRQFLGRLGLTADDAQQTTLAERGILMVPALVELDERCRVVRSSPGVEPALGWVFNREESVW